MPLRGLTVDEVHRMYEAIRGQATPWAQAEAVHRQTEGNPLFVQEVLRYLVEEGFVVREDGRYVAPKACGRRHPGGPARRRRQAPVAPGEKTNQVLAIAAVIGRDFRLDVLQLVAGLPEEELYAALEEAVERAVIEERQRRRRRGRLSLHPRLLPPDAVRGDDRAAPHPAAPAGGARARNGLRPALKSTPPSSRSTTRTPRARKT